MQVLGGPDGSQAVGWPAFHKSTMHASPLLYDIDFDGIRDVLLATYDGEIVFVKDTVRRSFDTDLNRSRNIRVLPGA